MNRDICVELKTMPSLLSLYRKIFFGRKPGWDQQPLPHVVIKCPQVSLSGDKVAQYARVCGFEFDGRVLPPTYLYVSAFRLHTSIFVRDVITFPLLGMIHLKNRITQYRPLLLQDNYDLECEIGNSQITASGLEFEFVSKAFVAGELVWESLSTYLYRVETSGRRVRPPKASPMNWHDPVTWSLTDDLGRRYARASGDYNLIHLHPVLSKRFGFDRVLAHGMWSKARSVAQLMSEIGDRPCTLEVVFKLPLLMPAQVSFAFEDDGAEGLKFELRDAKGRRPHLTGQVTFL